MVEILECDFNNTEHRNAIVFLMNHYMEDEMGGVPPLNDTKAEKMVAGLRDHPSKLVLLVRVNNEFAGLTNCFINFGTFQVKPFINIHDIIVLDKYRGKGIGKKLMEAVIEYARKNDFGKITLEVRADNIRAQKLYKSCGFGESNPIMHFWSKYF